MNAFVEQLRLAEMAAENIYFAKVDRELIESLHERMQQGYDPFQRFYSAPMMANDVSRGVTNE